MQGKLIIFSAPSGAGKTTIVKHLLHKFSQLEFSVSACSRPKRQGEQEGVDYYFLTVSQFKEKIANAEFVEWQEVYHEQYYGTLKSEIERIWSHGKQVIFDVDVEGGLNLKKAFGEKALAVFVMPPSIQHLENRLTLRQTETPESIKKRTTKAITELLTSKQFDQIVVNDDLQQAFVEAEKVVADFLKL